MRNISCYYTQEQIRNRTKTVTRRLGWANAKPGELLQVVVKGQGLKKGEHVEKMVVIRVLENDPEPLDNIIKYPRRWHKIKDYKWVWETVREGFPDMTPQEFVVMFCKTNKCEPGTVINRIAFDYEDKP